MEDLIDMIKSHILDIEKVSTKDFSLYQRSIMDDLGSWLVNNLINNNITRGEWLLFNTNSAIFQLYHGENDDEIRFVLDQHDLPY
jgi:hypothetical protein